MLLCVPWVQLVSTRDNLKYPIVLYSWIVFHCLCVPFFFIIHSSDKRHLSCWPYYCKQNGNEHGWKSTCEVNVKSFGHVPRSGIDESYGRFTLAFMEFPSLISIVVWHFAISWTLNRCFCFPTSSLHLLSFFSSWLLLFWQG